MKLTGTFVLTTRLFVVVLLILGYCQELERNEDSSFCLVSSSFIVSERLLAITRRSLRFVVSVIESEITCMVH